MQWQPRERQEITNDFEDMVTPPSPKARVSGLLTDFSPMKKD